MLNPKAIYSKFEYEKSKFLAKIFLPSFNLEVKYGGVYCKFSILFRGKFFQPYSADYIHIIS